MSDGTDGWRGKQVINNEGLSKVASAVILGLKVGHCTRRDLCTYCVTCHVEKLLICQM